MPNQPSRALYMLPLCRQIAEEAKRGVDRLPASIEQQLQDLAPEERTNLEWYCRGRAEEQAIYLAHRRIAQATGDPRNIPVEIDRPTDDWIPNFSPFSIPSLKDFALADEIEPFENDGSGPGETPVRLWSYTAFLAAVIFIIAFLFVLVRNQASENADREAEIHALR